MKIVLFKFHEPAYGGACGTRIPAKAYMADFTHKRLSVPDNEPVLLAIIWEWWWATERHLYRALDEKELIDARVS